MSIKRLSVAEILLIVLFAFVPLFITLPYRINIFLSWEGAYRMSNGQIPFRDFGAPIGGVYWAVPALFMKIFGPQMISLVKAQVFLNIISGLSFRSILKTIRTDPAVRFIALVIFILSFSFINFWPWYNHSVIVYELVALAFLLKYIYTEKRRSATWLLIAAAFFSGCSFLTKQDAGALTILISVVLLVYAAIIEKKWLAPVIYTTSVVVFITVYILLTDPSGFGYWFNHGQAPHSSRVQASDMLEEFFGGSQWIKFYLVLIVLLSLRLFSDLKHSFRDKEVFIPLLLVLGILAEAVIFSVTSYVPPDNNIFFHSFAVAYILNALLKQSVPAERRQLFFYAALGCVLIWWSPNYWRYMQVLLRPLIGDARPASTNGENVVDRNTYKFSDVDMGVPMHEWKESGLYTLQKITMPPPTIDGITRLKLMPELKKQGLKLLNMTELTSLAAEIPYALEKGNDYPLWFHLGVGMFNKQAIMFENRIRSAHYDLILFQYIPSLNNFYPFRVRDTLMRHYQKVDSFMAPRRGETQGMIEVFTRRSATDTLQN